MRAAGGGVCVRCPGGGSLLPHVEGPEADGRTVGLVSAALQYPLPHHWCGDEERVQHIHRYVGFPYRPLDPSRRVFVITSGLLMVADNLRNVRRGESRTYYFSLFHGIQASADKNAEERIVKREQDKLRPAFLKL